MSGPFVYLRWAEGLVSKLAAGTEGRSITFEAWLEAGTLSRLSLALITGAGHPPFLGFL
jgi:hypothetical protein